MKMKGFSGLFVVVYLFCAVIAFPTSDLNEEDAEIVVVPLEAQQERSDNQRVDGLPFYSFAPYNPFRWNFGFFDDFNNILRQLRERVNNAWSDVPVASDSDPSVKSNTTSRVEYINGRKVVINDTFYTKETDFGTSVYNVRVIDFLPENDETTSSTTNDGSPELDDDDESGIESNNNGELDKGSPEELDNNDHDNEINRDIDDVENFELDDDNNQQQQLQNHHQHHQLLQHQQQQQQEQQQQPPLEEQNYTNNRLEEFMPNNEYNSPSPTNEHSWDSIEDENENVNENINMNEHYPVDLSNDIAINQIAADQGVPYDSDAEIFSIDEHVQYPISTTYEFVPVDIKK